MTRDVEVADAEHEIERVDVVGGGGQRGEMGEQEDGGDRRQDSPRSAVGGHSIGRRRSASLRLPRR